MQTILLILYFKKRVKQSACFKQCVIVTPPLCGTSCNILKYFFQWLALSSLFKTKDSGQSQVYTTGEEIKNNLTETMLSFQCDPIKFLSIDTSMLKPV